MATWQVLLKEIGSKVLLAAVITFLDEATSKILGKQKSIEYNEIPNKKEQETQHKKSPNLLIK
jgi:hypothetical protein